MDVVMRPWLGEPRWWQVVFDRSTDYPWFDRLPFIGKYKHVRAFGFVPEAKAWIFYEPSLKRQSVKIACDDAALLLMREWLLNADCIGMPVVYRQSMWPRLGGWCVPAIKHLIGLRSGALRPDALWRDCLANGGEIVANGSPKPAAIHAGPAASAAGAAG